MNTVFRAVADPTRRAILDCLASKEESVMKLAASFDITLPAVSQHLRVLQDAHLVARRRDGRKIFYRLNPEPLSEVARWIHPYERFWRKRLRALGEHLRRKHGDHHP
jgi:DNA-binding transcriptional ArsR family regulator